MKGIDRTVHAFGAAPVMAIPCLVNAKADAHICCVVPALKHPNVTLITDAKVTRLETDGSGREVTGVEVERNGQKKVTRAKLLCCPQAQSIQPRCCCVRLMTNTRMASPMARMS